MLWHSLSIYSTKMCGRYALMAKQEELARRFLLRKMSEELLKTLRPRFNISPSQTVAAFRASREDGAREGVNLSWGLVPFWAKDFKISCKMINARSESAAEKPAFRAAFKSRRCIIPASGFYEWHRPKDEGRKQPFFFSLKEDEPMALAGLWERWRDPHGENRETCAILTTSANEIMQGVYHRMPVILGEESLDLWLDPSVAERKRLEPLFRPFLSERMRRIPVSNLVNSPKNDGPELLEEVDLETGQFLNSQGLLFSDLDDD